MSSGQVSGDKAKAGIMVVKSNANPAFISRYPPQTRLIKGWMDSPNIDDMTYFPSGTLDIANYRGQLWFNHNKKSGADQLQTEITSK